VSYIRKYLFSKVTEAVADPDPFAVITSENNARYLPNAEKIVGT
jgi:hypothetical protein